MADRKADTRRKVLAGAWALREADRDQAFRRHLKAGLSDFLPRWDVPLFAHLLDDEEALAE